MKRPFYYTLGLSFFAPLICAGIFAVPQKAQASAIAGFVWDAPQIGLGFEEWGERALKDMWEAMVRAVARQLIEEITAQTVDWINSGFNGNPAFIDNPQGLLQKVADRAVGQMIAGNKDLRFLCEPFELQIRLALGLSYGGGLQRSIGCTWTNVVQNVTNANLGISVDLSAQDFRAEQNRFVQQGGWDNWLSRTTQPQNNAQGAFLMAKSSLDAQITGKQEAAKAELSFGAGALSYKTCTKNYYQPGSDVVERSEEFKGSDLTYEDGQDGSENGQYYDFTCKTTTPGRVITDMITGQANSDRNIGELQAALGNGFDAILGALANQIVTRGLSALQNGLLGDNSTANNGYRSEINLSIARAQTNFNAQTQRMSDTANNTAQVTGEDRFRTQLPIPDGESIFGPYGSSFGDGFASGFLNPRSSLAGGAGDTISCQALTTAQINALRRVNQLLTEETQYRNMYDAPRRLLSEGQAIFVNARACNAGTNDVSSVLRARNIEDNIITNIDGTANSNRTIADIPWNLAALGAEVDIINGRIAMLTAAKTAIIGANTETSTSSVITANIDIIMTTINSTTWSTAPSLVTGNIAGWLRSVENFYNSAQCPIDVSAPIARAEAVTVDDSVARAVAQVNANACSVASVQRSPVYVVSTSSLPTGETRTTILNALQDQLSEVVIVRENIISTMRSLQDSIGRTADPSAQSILRQSLAEQESNLAAMDTLQRQIDAELAKLLNVRSGTADERLGQALASIRASITAKQNQVYSVIIPSQCASYGLRTGCSGENPAYRPALERRAALQRELDALRQQEQVLLAQINSGR